MLFRSGCYPAFGTHDDTIIEEVITLAGANGWQPNEFEFEMLYGVRRDLQASLLARGYGVRIYLPFGSEWFPYFMRRLAERPANVAFVIKSILYEQKG